ncbi:uncharacterized protein LOC115965042 [Quercus lobata]|uniref:uncharacterized protein LOC115965042 n=1 Tax=Quercus lobata TaxID=97700 RepID=UPI001246FC0E|nr:uncharacterized protein LOC115965042 [Quercus lobata]
MRIKLEPSSPMMMLCTLRPPIGTINVILTAPGRTGSHPFRVMLVARLPAEADDYESKRAKGMAWPILGFSNEDKVGTIQPHDDALVITLRIGGYDMKRVLVDQGSAVELMYPDLYKGLRLRPEDLTAYDSSLVSFEWKTITLKVQIRLPIQTGLDIVEVDFIVVDTYSPYTAIVDRCWLHALGAVSSTLHQKVKYPSEGRVKEVIGDQAMARQCMVGSKLPPQEKEKLIDFLKENVDVFVWDTYEAPGVNPNFICHHLNVSLAVTPKKQPPRRPSKEHVDAVREEVMKLKKAGAIKEVFYPEWLANTVVVRKKSGKWRVCVDFTNLNKACLKDPFPMPRIDRLVDSTVGHP